MLKYDIIIIGGGAAGLLAAIKAKEEGCQNILIIEREEQLGGALNQYIHLVYGFDKLNKTMTGPEYAQVLIDKINELRINYILDTLVIDITKDKNITVVNKGGIIEYRAKAIILAMGSREKPRGVINTPNSRCAGVFTVGTAQKFVNTEGYIPGRQVAIIGSGDNGLLAARNLMLEGANIKAIIDLKPYATGSKNNIEECIEDFNMPFKPSCAVLDIKGKDRVEGIIIAKVDKENIPVNGTEEYISCDTLLLSTNLLPESHLLKKAGLKVSKVTEGVEVYKDFNTSEEGIFACGDVIYVHDLEEDIVEECNTAGRNAAYYVPKNISSI